MGKEKGDNDLYAFAVAQIRMKELSLLSDQALDTLRSFKTAEEVIQYLEDKGWGPVEEGVSYEELLKNEKNKCWNFIKHLCNPEQYHYFDVFETSRDFHNLKAAIKESYIQKEVPGVFMESGKIPLEKIKAAAEDNDFSHLPLSMSRAASEARGILFSTGDSQLCDCIIDKACMAEMYKLSKSIDNELIKKYTELKCAAANINIAVRACRAGKDGEFLKRAFAECQSISVTGLLNAARNGLDAVFEFLETTSYKDAVPAIMQGGAAFDKWCDDRMIELVKPQKYNAFTVSPLVAYVIAKETEIKSVRIILSGKINQLPDEKIKERIRESYV